MKKIKSCLVIAAIIFTALPLMAQQKRVSPHETISTVIDGDRVTIVYGRPYTKDPKSGAPRKIWGELVPNGEVWRLGADESTLLITQKTMTFGETEIPAGAYSLYLLPQADGSAKLIISKQLGEWGAYQYNEKQDFARIDLKKEALEKTADQLTIAISKNSPAGGILKISWENTQYSAPFTVKK
ncbi:MAG: DUF2911 domain-containing protein [Limisphaerales bacterium]